MKVEKFEARLQIGRAEKVFESVGVQLKKSMTVE
jgi:hypothetical protein